MHYKITLIFTQHQENGLCTSNALQDIIELIKPEVIFEELTLSLYQKAYVEGILNNLESVAIRNYLKSHNAEHIPVDTYDRPENYNWNQNSLYSKLTGGANMHSFHLRGLLDHQFSAIRENGIPLLNSEWNEKIMNEMDDLKKKALDVLDDKELTELYHLDKEVIESREETMLDNVYKYSRENAYENAIMFIGSGHMKSIKKKIEVRIRTEDVQINWYFYSDLIRVSQT